MAFCSNCGTQIPEGSTTCAACAAAGARGGTSQTGSTAGITDNVAGMLAYLFIPAIVFLFVEPYNRNRFIRFHSFQSIILGVVLFIFNLVLANILWGSSFFFGGWGIYSILRLAELVLWIFLLVKAYQGEKFKLPVIGDMAEKQANTV